MKKIIMSVIGIGVLFGATVICMALQPAGEPRIETFAFVGPGPAQPNYASFAQNAVQAIYGTNGRPAGAIEYRLDPALLMQSASLNSNGIWFAVKISSSNLFFPTNAVFIQRSTDTNNTFGGTYWLTNGAYSYSPQGFGVIWGSGGPRFNDTFVTSGLLSSQPVNEYIYIGVWSKYLPYTSEAQRQAYLTEFAAMPGFSTTGTWELRSNNLPIQHSSKTLRTQSVPPPAILSIVQEGSKIATGVNCDTNDTYNMFFVTPLGTSWLKIGTANSGDVFEKPNVGEGYFQLKLQ